MTREREQDDASSRLMIAARRFLEFATTSPVDEPDRLLKLIRLLDALNAAVIEVQRRIPEDSAYEWPDRFEPLRTRWPELDAGYPTAALQTEQDWIDGDREAAIALVLVDLADICSEIAQSLAILEQHDERTAAEHLAWTHDAHWIWHAHGLRYFLARQILKQLPPQVP